MQDRRSARLQEALRPDPGVNVMTPLGEGEHEGGLLRITPLTERVGLRLEGEIDVSNRDDVGKALSLLAGTDDDIYLELDGLRFIDVGGMAVLAGFAARLAPRRLVLMNPPYLLRRLVNLLWRDAPGLQMRP